MKNTLSTAMLLAALLGDAHAKTGYITSPDDTQPAAPGGVYGIYAQGDASGGSVAVFESIESSYDELDTVSGGMSDEGNATSNTVTMTGGTVRELQGGYAPAGNVANNTVTMSGGSAAHLYGGVSLAGKVSNNLVVFTGAASCGEALFGGYSSQSSSDNNAVILSGGNKCQNVNGAYGKTSASNNRVHLVGEGFQGMVENVEVKGSAIEVGHVAAGKVDKGTVADNAIHLYGSGIEVGGWAGFQSLNFHLENGLLTSAKPMVALTETLTFALTGDFELSFDAVGIMDWQPGDSVTLVSAQSIFVLHPEELDREYNIYQYGDLEKINPVATGKLNNEGNLLKLVVTSVIPEPATGTLSLLALAALATRRRRR